VVIYFITTMNKLKLPLPQSGGLILSYKCTAACRHCMYFCSPKWQADWFTGDDLIEFFSLLPRKINSSPWGDNYVSLNHGLHFSGGEPFLNYDLLLKAVEIAGEYNIPSTFVETNCF
jgi:pyruvate-formate lyase-activating enzyme